jgi:hypothetical protein
MRVINLKCSNRGAIEALEMPLNGKSVVVSGKTGTGKTTAISLLWDLIVKNPKIKKGKNKEEIEAYLEDEKGYRLICKRVNTENNSKITIIDEQGEKVSADYAKTLLSEISSNPLSLFEKTGKERFDFLLKCSTVDISEYQRLKQDRIIIAEERLSQKRLVDTLEKRKGSAPLEKIEEVDVSIIQKELQGAYSHNQQIEKSKITKSLKEERNSQIQTEIERLQKELEENLIFIARADEWLEDNQEINTNELEEKLSNASTINEKASQYKDWQEREKEYTKENKIWCNLDDSVKSIDKEIKKLIDSMEFSIHGLSVEDEVIYYNGVDYDSLGTSDQILISASLTAQSIINSKKQIHAIRIDRGESMDKDTQQKVIDVCSEIGVQVFISVVDRSNNDDGFQIDIIEGVQ